MSIADDLINRWSENREEAYGTAIKEYESATSIGLRFEFLRSDIAKAFRHYQFTNDGEVGGCADLTDYLVSQFSRGGERNSKNIASQNQTNIVIHPNHASFPDYIDRYVRINVRGFGHAYPTVKRKDIHDFVRNTLLRQIEDYNQALQSIIESSQNTVYLLAPNEKTDEYKIHEDSATIVRTKQYVDDEGDTVDVGAIDWGSIPEFFEATEGIRSTGDERDSFIVHGSFYGQCTRTIAVQLSALLNLGLYLPCNKPDRSLSQVEKQYDAAMDFLVRVACLQRPVVDISLGVLLDSSAIQKNEIEMANRSPGDIISKLSLAFRSDMTNIIPSADRFITIMQEEAKRLASQGSQ